MKKFKNIAYLFLYHAKSLSIFAWVILLLTPLLATILIGTEVFLPSATQKFTHFKIPAPATIPGYEVSILTSTTYSGYDFTYRIKGGKIYYLSNDNEYIRKVMKNIEQLEDLNNVFVEVSDISEARFFYSS